MSNQQRTSRRGFFGVLGGLALGLVIAGAGAYLSDHHEKRKHVISQETVTTEIPVTVEVQSRKTSADEFYDYVEFGDQGKPISEFPQLISAEGAKLKGLFTFENRYMIHLDIAKTRQILNGKNPAGYNPDTINDIGVLTLEPKTCDSADGISCVLNYGTKVSDKRRDLVLTFHDIRLLNPYGACDVVAFIKQTDGNYKFVGRA